CEDFNVRRGSPGTMSRTAGVRIVQARPGPAIDAARDMFQEYAAWLGISLCFQDFDQEFATLPGDYAPPRGHLLLALGGAAPVGCAALRPLEAAVCEMKRLYVRPSHRGRGVGRRLVDEILARARAVGYERVRLDTIPWKMQAAVAMYRDIGFRPIPPYTENPIEGVEYMELELRSDD
ncbi:MAG: GNAT family N-acetyltransferase, partial [bacterium]